MVRAKTDCCCCNDCSTALGGAAARCCSCVCDELCVRVTIPGPLLVSDLCVFECSGCVRADGVLTWDDALCAWTGTVSCGGLAIDLVVKITWCDGQCWICVTSQCLGMNGGCTSSGPVDCFGLTPGEGCGQYGKRCDPNGGMVFSFTHALSAGCIDPLLCGKEATLEFRCAPKVNPTATLGPDDDTPCRNCDCICETVCITYTEDGCSEVREATWDGSQWQATFNSDCDWAEQVVTITMEKVPGGDCCQWRIATSRGSASEPTIRTSCPDVDLSWTIRDEVSSFEGEVTVSCVYCGKCRIPHTCCPDDNVPIYLEFNMVFPDNDCPKTCITLALAKLSYSESIWRGYGYVYCSQEDGSCHGSQVTIEYVCIGHGPPLFDYTAFIRIYCDGDLVYEETATGLYCRPFCYCTFFNPTDVACFSPDAVCQVTQIDYCLLETCREVP